jgi:hypothetical protein
VNTLTMQDVADLAKVRRPVVSMWRKRPTVRGVSIPFPAPVSTVDGVERFASGEIVDYLQRSGRGNNADAPLDVPAVAVPDGIDIEDVVTLLALHALTGDDMAGSTREARVRRAMEHDPDDQLLVSEIEALDPPTALLEYIDELVEASFGLADALARVEGGRLKREVAPRDLTAGAVDVLGCLVSACAIYQGREGISLSAEGDPLSIRVADRSGLPLMAIDRRTRRRAVIKDVEFGDAAPSSVRFASVLGLNLADALDVADDVVLGLSSGQLAVIVGPAEVFTDDIRGELQRRRANVLRVGSVIAALRLPRGMWREAHRQSIAVWVCGGGTKVTHPWVADLAAVPTLDLTDLAADIAGALDGTEDRAYRYARQIDLNGVLVSGALVPRGVRAPVMRSADALDHVDRVHAATLVTTTPMDDLDVLVRPSPGRLRVRHRSLGELCADEKVIMKRGSRISGAGATPGGTVTVLPSELSGGFAFDPLDAERRYPRAMRTQPGDVIFVEKPQARAWVDHGGGAMVISPARVFRLDLGATVGPRLLAAVINTTGRGASEWQTWPVPEISRAEADRIEAALADVDRYESELHRRADAVDDLKKALIDGVAAGALTLDAQPTTPGVTVTHTEKGI